MIPLVKQLDTADFDSLMKAARSRLPALAKKWTDYNYHDPGIMLIELMAWLADSQIYSLARNRNDERLGFLRLMGSRAHGTLPAKGMVFPIGKPGTASPVAAGAILKEAYGSAPRLEAETAITLLPVEIKRLSVITDTGIKDVTQINKLSRTAFSPFGDDGKGQLVIKLAAEQIPANTDPIRLSLGFQLKDDKVDETPQQVGRICTRHTDGSPLHQICDTTFSMQHSGVMIFSLNAADLAKPITLRVEHGRLLGLQLLKVTPNALPVAQQAHLSYDARGNGRPGQTIEIEPNALFPADEAVKERSWRLADSTGLTVNSLPGGAPRNWVGGRLDEAGPSDARYAVEEASDGSRIRLRFGNGINGARPGLDEPISVGLVLSCGLAGGIAQPTDWIMTPTGTRWHNDEPIAGGVDTQTPDEALNDLRDRLAERRPLATSRQIESAVKDLPHALGIARAYIEKGWERGRRAPAVPATRTLLITSVHAGSEDQVWLETIRRHLAPRIAAGERLLVIAPRYRHFQLAVSIVSMRGTRPAQVAEDVRKALSDRFDPSKNCWPFGRDVSAAAIAGWACKVTGVSGVSAVDLRPADGGASVPWIPVGRGELPLLDGAPLVTVERQPR